MSPCTKVIRLHYYLAIIRPVLEYSAPVWHHSKVPDKSDRVNTKGWYCMYRQYILYSVLHFGSTCLQLKMGTWKNTGTYFRMITLNMSCTNCSQKHAWIPIDSNTGSRFQCFNKCTRSDKWKEITCGLITWEMLISQRYCDEFTITSQ